MAGAVAMLAYLHVYLPWRARRGGGTLASLADSLRYSLRGGRPADRLLKPSACRTRVAPQSSEPMRRAHGNVIKGSSKPGASKADHKPGGSKRTLGSRLGSSTRATSTKGAAYQKLGKSTSSKGAGQTSSTEFRS